MLEQPSERVYVAGATRVLHCQRRVQLCTGAERRAVCHRSRSAPRRPRSARLSVGAAATCLSLAPSGPLPSEDKHCFHLVRVCFNIHDSAAQACALTQRDQRAHMACRWVQLSRAGAPRITLVAKACAGFCTAYCVWRTAGKCILDNLPMCPLRLALHAPALPPRARVCPANGLAMTAAIRPSVGVAGRPAGLERPCRRQGGDLSGQRP